MLIPIENLWALVVGLTVLAVTASIHAVTSRHSAKMMEKEVSALLTKIADLDKSYNDKVSSISNLHKAEVDKISISHKEEVQRAIDEFHGSRSPIHDILVGMGYYNKK